MSFFKRQPKPTLKDEKGNSDEAQKVFAALKDGFEKMKARQIERVVIAVQETPKEDRKPAPNTGWTTAEDAKCQYYPYEILNADEKKMISEKKDYVAISLVLGKGHNVTYFAGEGIEIAMRTRLHWLLLPMKDSWFMHYSSDMSHYTDKQMMEFAEMNAKNGWTAAEAKNSVERGMEEYASKTRELMKEAGVYAALERMENGISGISAILSDVRKQISDAKN